ncbi:AsmA family protein [Photobacterium sanctipauli]|uniref:AsmA family protein n=1 Tax=Photobacterium sanctipauli TaxID=1342794 RepID=A0A2T3NXA1_9GAMM|nr:AsmA family protein [Photobacterium sanctipauli]PSW20828.1 AsmA family protein [Photobacterium sanctipauli]
MSQEKKTPTATATHSQPQQPVGKHHRLRKLAKWVGIGLATPIAITTTVLSYGIQVDLNPYREDISQWLSSSLERDVQIEGDIGLLLSFRPEVNFNGVNIANIDAFQWQPMLSSGKLSAKIGVLPLINGTLAVDYLELEDIRLNLGKSHNGEVNWVFGSAQPNASEKTTQPQESGSPLTLALSEHITATNIALVYEDQSEGLYFDWYLNNLTLSQPEDNWQFAAQGSVIGQTYDIRLAGDLEQLINHQQGKLAASGQFAGAELNIDAEIVPPSQGESVADVALNWQNTQPIEALLGLDVKHVAPLNITTQLRASANSLSVKELVIDSPITQGNGYLDITLGEHNTIDGELTIPLIDLRPWLQPEPMPMMRAFSSAPPQQSPLQRALDQWLMKTTTRLDLAVHEIKGLGTPVENLSLSVTGKDGVLAAPMTADIAEVPFRGQAELNATSGLSTLDISLGAKQSPLGEMARWLTGMPYARGNLDYAELLVNTQGTKLSEWLNNSQVALAVDKAIVEWGSEASFSIDQARLSAGINQPFQSDIQGQLMGLPAHIQARAGTLGDILNQRDWQTTLTLDSPALNINAKGLLKQTRWQEGSWFDLTIHGDDASKLSPWLGTQTNISGAINIDGKLNYQQGWVALAMPNLNVMDSQGDINVRWRPDAQRPFLHLDANFAKLDFTQFGQFINDEELPQVEQTVPTQGVNLDVPLLGSEIVIADADLNVQVDTLKWAQQQIDDLTFNGQLRDGRMSPAPFKARYIGSEYSGDLALGINNAAIDAKLNLAVSQPDVGAILSTFDISNDFDIQLQRARLAVALSGSTLLELMEHTSVNAELFGGQASIADSYTGKAMTVKLDNGRFLTGPDTATVLSFHGIAAGQATRFKLDTLSLKQVNDGRDTLPVNLALNIGDMRFDAHSQLALPIDMQNLDMAFEAYTPNLDRFAAFSDIELPPYGPLTLKAQLASNQEGYHLSDLLIQVNESQLTGKGSYLPPLKPDAIPHLSLALRAPFIQLDDFKAGDWQPWEPEQPQEQATAKEGNLKQEATTDEATTKEASNNEQVEPAPQTALISPEGLDMLTANFQLNVGEVRSGNDWLGSGELDWHLKDGIFTLEPLHVKLPGGDIKLDSTIKAQGEMFDIQFNGNITNFDYGVLARRLSPETDMHGRLSTEFQLTSLANSPDTLMNNANGFIGFAVWPQTFEADLIDLWAVSLTDAILPSFTKDDPSVLNCVAAGLDIKQGQMQQRDLMLDTTRIQVNGQFDASYADRQFGLYLRPQSKRAQIFSLQTPVEVTGKFEDFDFSVPLSAILETSVRFTTSPVISPLRWLVEKPIAPNGSQQCELIWQGKA